MDNITIKLLANRDWSWLYGLSSIGGSITTYAFGGMNGMLELLFTFFAIDYITGIGASLREKRGLKSTIGAFGIFKKGLMLLMVLMGHKIDTALGMNFVMSGVIWFWLANELVSILENYGRIGIKVPPVLKKVLSVLQEKSSESIKSEKEENK